MTGSKPVASRQVVMGVRTAQKAEKSTLPSSHEARRLRGLFWDSVSGSEVNTLSVAITTQ